MAGQMSNFRNIEKPRRICYVDKSSCPKELLERDLMAKAMFLTDISYEPNNSNNIQRSHTLYVINDFENNPDMEILEKIPNIWVFGTQALSERSSKLRRGLTRKYLFCTSMEGLRFHIHCPRNIDLMKRMVQLIEWMGGRFTRDPNAKITHMITTSTLANGYNSCMSSNVPILYPDWVKECWKNRHQIGFKAASIAVNYKLKPFAGLGISFVGSSPVMIASMEEDAKENGAEIVHFEDPACTHMVAEKDLQNNMGIEEIPLHVQYVVLTKWFRSSLHQQRRANELYYSLFHVSSLSQTKLGKENNVKLHRPRKEYETIVISSDLSEDEELTENVHVASSAETSKDNERNDVLLKKEDRRKDVFKKLCETEKSYIQSLELLCRIRLEATDTILPGGAILNQTESKIIFKSWDEILQVHKQIEKQLLKNLSYWDSVKKAEAFIIFKKEMMEHYMLFASNWTERESYKNENPRFLELLKEFGEFGGSKDLFIRPIQRLPSIVILLKEIIENTRADSPDIQYLKEARQSIFDVSEMMNEDRAKIERQQEKFVIHKMIENYPPDLIAARREFIEKFFAREVTNKENELGVRLVFFLFNDVLEVAKVRSKCNYRRLFRHNHEMETNVEKPLKHVAVIPLTAISHVLQFKEDVDCNRELFGFNMRDDNDHKTINCFQYLDTKLKFEDMLNLMTKQLKRNQTSTSKEEADFIKQTNLSVPNLIYIFLLNSITLNAEQHSK